MTDQRCAQARAGNFGRASRIDSQRSQRLLLAALNGDHNGADIVTTEIGDCPDCLRGSIVFLVNALCSSLLQSAGGDSELLLNTIAQVPADTLDMHTAEP